MQHIDNITIFQKRILTCSIGNKQWLNSSRHFWENPKVCVVWRVLQFLTRILCLCGALHRGHWEREFTLARHQEDDKPLLNGRGTALYTEGLGPTPTTKINKEKDALKGLTVWDKNLPTVDFTVVPYCLLLKLKDKTQESLLLRLGLFISTLFLHTYT